MNTKEILQGIKDWVAPKVIYDISAAHNNTKYADLAAALGTNGSNVPESYRSGGMSVKFVQSSDNKYVQFRYIGISTANADFINVANWQGVDDEPTAGSNNLVKSGGVYSLKEKSMMRNIYTSTTGNFLDVNNVLEGYRINYNTHLVEQEEGALLSQFIYVGDTSVISVSGYTAQYYRQLIFLTKADFASYISGQFYNLTGTARTNITVPTNAKYVLICLKYHATQTEDYVNMKLSKTSEVTTDSYVGKFLGIVGQENTFSKTIVIQDDVVDNLTTNSSTKVLSAKQGKTLKTQADSLGTAQSKLFVTQLMDSNGIKNTIDAVYGSSTDNFLDIENVIYGLGLYHNGSTSMFLYGDKGSITSRLIPVKGASKVTISGYTKNDLFVQFLFSREIEYNRTYTYRLTDTSRTINVPSGAIYMLVGLQSKTDSPHDYSNMKVSLSDTAAVGSFTPVFYGYAGYSDLLQKTIMSWEDFPTKVQYQSQSKNILDTSVPFSKVRVSYTEPYFVFDNNVIISYPIYVKGRDKITWTTTYPSLVFIRYIAFCTDASMTDASVIEVKDPGFNVSSTSKQVKTIPVPPTAVYMFVNIGNRNSESQAYKNDTIAFGEEETDDQYVPIAFKVDETPFYPDVKFQEIDKKLEGLGGTIDFIKETERTNTLKRYVPYSVGSPSASAGWGGQYERLNLLFFTDNHIDTPSANPIPSRQNVSDVYDFVENCPIALDAIINAGDTITPFGVTTKPVQKASIGYFFNECKRIETIPTLYSVGNHDTNDWFNYQSNAFTDDDWSEMWYDWAEQTYGIVRQAKSSGKKSTWHYYDIESKKVRIICIDVMDADKSIVNENNKVVYYGGVGFYISNEQFNWVANTALNFDDKDEKDWGVIIVSHVGTTYGVNCKDANDGTQIQSWVSGTSYAVGELVKESNVSYRCIEANSDSVFDNSKWKELNPEKDIDKFSLMLKAFNEQSTYSESYTFSGDSYFNLSVSADWTRYSNLEKKPYIICWLIGHEHTDKNTAINGIQMIWSLNGSCSTESSDNRVARIPGSSTQNSFDLISIDLKDKKIRIVKYGAGVTCYGAGGDRFLPDGLSF